MTCASRLQAIKRSTVYHAVRINPSNKNHEYSYLVYFRREKTRNLRRLVGTNSRLKDTLIKSKVTDNQIVPGNGPSAVKDHPSSAAKRVVRYLNYRHRIGLQFHPNRAPKCGIRASEEQSSVYRWGQTVPVSSGSMTVSGADGDVDTRS